MFGIHPMAKLIHLMSAICAKDALKFTKMLLQFGLVK